MRRVALATIVVALIPIAAASQTESGQIAFGGRHAIALRTNGDVITWGNNVMCQLGRRAGNQNGDPGLVLRNGVQVAPASDHSLAVTRDGPLANVVSVDAGTWHSSAVAADGAVWVGQQRQIATLRRHDNEPCRASNGHVAWRR